MSQHSIDDKSGDMVLSNSASRQAQDETTGLNKSFVVNEMVANSAHGREMQTPSSVSQGRGQNVQSSPMLSSQDTDRGGGTSVRGSQFAQTIEITVTLAKRRWMYLRDLVLSGAQKQYQYYLPQDNADSLDNAKDKSNTTAANQTSEVEDQSPRPTNTLKKKKKKAYGILRPQDPLVKACKRGDVGSLRSIIAGYDEGYDITAYLNAIDVAGSHSIFHTVWPGHHQALDILLRHKADPNQQNNRLNTALHLACERLNRRIIKLLITHGAKVDVVNSKGQQCYETCYTPEDQMAIKSYVQRLVVAQEGKFEVDSMVLRLPKKDDFGPFHKDYYVSRDKRRDMLMRTLKEKEVLPVVPEVEQGFRDNKGQTLHVIHTSMMQTQKQLTYGGSTGKETLPAPCSNRPYTADGAVYYDSVVQINREDFSLTPRARMVKHLRGMKKQQDGLQKHKKEEVMIPKVDTIERRPDVSELVKDTNAKMGRRVYYAHQLEEEKGNKVDSKQGAQDGRPKTSCMIAKLAPMVRGCLYYREETLVEPSVFVPPKVPHKPTVKSEFGQKFKYADAKEQHGSQLDQIHLGVKISGQRRGSEAHRQDVARLEMVVRALKSGKRLLPMDARVGRRLSLSYPGMHGHMVMTPKASRSTAGRRFSVIGADVENAEFSGLFTTTTTLGGNEIPPKSKEMTKHNLQNKKDVDRLTELGLQVYRRTAKSELGNATSTLPKKQYTLDELLQQHEEEQEESKNKGERQDLSITDSIYEEQMMRGYRGSNASRTSQMSRSVTSRHTQSRTSQRSDLLPVVHQALFMRGASREAVPNTEETRLPTSTLSIPATPSIASKGAREIEHDTLKKASERTQTDKINRATTRRQQWTSLRKTRQSKDQEFLQFVNKHI